MKKLIITAIIFLSISLCGKAQHIVRIDTVLVPYFQFDNEEWLQSDSLHKCVHEGLYFDCYPGNPQRPIIPMHANMLNYHTLFGDQLQYNYIEGGADIYGIATWVHIQDTTTTNYPQEDLYLYDAMPDTFMLKAVVPYNPLVPSNGYNIRFRSRWFDHDKYYCDSAAEWVQYVGSTHHKILFDKPIHVDDSFYVGATQRRWEAAYLWTYSLTDNRIEPYPRPTFYHWGYIMVGNRGMNGDSTCWPRIKLKQRWTMNNPILYPVSISVWGDTVPEGYVLNQWVDREAVDFCLIVPIIGKTDTLWDYELTECPWVRWLNVTGVYGDTTVLRWDRYDHTYSQWQLSYGPKGIRPEDGTLVNCSRPTWRHIDSLHRADTLVAWVRTVCHEEGYEYYSAWSDSVVWCGAGQPLWTERPNGNAVTDGMVRLTPNPANADVTVSSAYRLLGVEAYAMDGRNIYKADAHGLTHTLSVKGWPQGTYLLLVETASGIATKKLVVRP